MSILNTGPNAGCKPMESSGRRTYDKLAEVAVDNRRGRNFRQLLQAKLDLQKISE